ncbi:MAG: phosphotransferase [Pseudomonadales bacterium]
MASDAREYLPETPEALTADWLSSALGVAIDDVHRRPVGEGLGFMGDVLRLTLETDDPAAPASVVAKIPRIATRAMGEMLGVYEREIMFYRTLADAVPVRIPRLVYAGFDRDRGSENQEKILRTLDRMPQFLLGAITALGARVAAAKKRRYVLIIEDLAGMQPADQLAGLDEAGCSRVLTEIAPLHRAFWKSPQLDGHFWLLPLDVDARLRHNRFKQSRERFTALLGPELADTLRWLDDHGEALSRRFVADAPATLSHCDLRLDNVMFDGDRCAFIDWQLLRRAPAAYDVAYFLSGALHEDCEPAAEDRILRRYHEVLDVASYPFVAFHRDYQRAMLLNLANLASADEVDLGNDRGSAMMATWMRRLAARARRIDPADTLRESTRTT